VVIVVLESTRADATTVYAPSLPTTPTLAALAATGTRVERAYAVVPHTSKALVAILCGLEPQQTTEIFEAGEQGLPAACLPRLLGDLGYDSAFFQAPHGDFERRSGLARNMGFDNFFSGDRMPAEGFEKINYFGYEDAIVLEPSERWLRTQAREPFLAVYLSSATHHPYRVPSSFPVQVFSKAEWNPYLNAVHYTDGVLARILAQYEAAGLFERTLFVVVGDHGEAFGEHDLSKHDDVMYEEGLRVPLVLRAPAAAGLPASVPGPVNQLDLAPTILSILGLRSEEGEWEGRSLFDPGPADRPLYAACFRNPHCLATVRGNFKLLHYFEDRPAELFDLAADPAERSNLAASRRDLVDLWTPDLLAWANSVHAMYASQTAEMLARYVSSTPPATFRGVPSGRFGSVLDVLVCNGRRRARANFEVQCVLRVLSGLDDSYRLRVRASAAAADGVDTQIFDHKPVRGLYPMRDWKPGDYIHDNFIGFAPLHWEDRTVSLCLELQDGAGAALELIPPPPSGGRCLPFAVLPPRTPAPARTSAAPPRP
jgi:arylsulfatase A-like enzyme